MLKKPVVILNIALGILWPLDASAQASKPTDLTCLEDLSEVASEDALKQLDSVLAQIDAMPSTRDLIQAMQQVLDQGKGLLGYCEIELRLRSIKANTRLLALPVESTVDSSSNQFSLFYSQPVEASHGIPKFAIWYEREGELAARAKLRAAGIDPSENLNNLNVTGTMAVSTAVHSRYYIAKEENRSQLNPLYRYIYDALEEYRISGALSNHYNTDLLSAADNYLEFSKSARYSINDRISTDVLQFFVIDKDPKRLLAGKSCNCNYVPKTNLILCDKRLLEALSNWVVYGKVDRPGPLVWANQMMAGFMLHWVVGHEVGHYVHKDNYDAGFVGLGDNSAVSRPAVNIAEYERAADSFAIEHMSPEFASAGTMAINYAILQLFGKAGGSLSDPKKIVLRNAPNEHPSLLSRVFALGEYLDVLDFLHKDIQKSVVFSSNMGGDSPSFCSLPKQPKPNIKAGDR